MLAEGMPETYSVGPVMAQMRPPGMSALALLLEHEGASRKHRKGDVHDPENPSGFRNSGHYLANYIVCD